MIASEIFKLIDQCQSLDELNKMNIWLDDYFYNKIFWDSRYVALTSQNPIERKKALLRCSYISQLFSATIPVSVNINPFHAPHSFKGMFISMYAKLGKGCTIFQNVTIGSNTLPDSKNAGFPTIGENVYIGAGANIIGNVKIGNNVRIGAGCSVTTDVPDNATVVQSSPVIIRKDKAPVNRYLGADEFLNFKPAPAAARPYSRTIDWRARRTFDDAFTILFCGDLILLEDQVKRAYTGSGYDFTPMFEYTRKYIRAADFSIGVFEGPLGGDEREYSQGNYDDGKYLYLNYPDEFADAVKDAGFDLVTTATNHILDMGVDGLRRSLEVLDQKQLEHIGTYRSPEDKVARRVKIIERDGIKMAFLAYTEVVNGFNQVQFTSGGEHESTTSILVFVNHPKFQDVINRVWQDFQLAKSQKPDLIVVLPHWGAEFTDKPNEF